MNICFSIFWYVVSFDEINLTVEDEYYLIYALRQKDSICVLSLNCHG